MFNQIRRISKFPNLPECNYIPKEYQGPPLNKMTEIRNAYLNPALTTYYRKPIMFHQGHMQYLFDINNNRYLDMFGGICTVSVGHCHPKVTEAVTNQMKTLGHVSNIYYHDKIHEYAERLSSTLPGDLKVIYLVNSGSEANDLATLLSRVYTKKFDIVSIRNCYHGMTYQIMAMTSNRFYKYPVPQSPGFFTTMNPDPYRGIWGGNKCRDSPIQTDRHCDCEGECVAGQKYVDEFQTVLDTNIGKNNLAAFFAESIQGVNGAVQFPTNYIRKIYDIVKKEGGLFISDEVQSGFGRTGDHFWAFQSHGIQPDIVTMAKGIGNGFPLAAVVTTQEVAQALTEAGHFNTFGGNPLACAAGIAVLNVIEEEKLQLNCKEIGTYLLVELKKLKERYNMVGDVRGKGLMIGVEMVEKDSNKPLSPEKFLLFWEDLRNKNLIVGKGGMHGNVLRIKPPMCITKEDANFTLHVLECALENLHNM